MHIYFSGIGGVGIGPLAEIALDAGEQVSGSDKQNSPMIDALRSRGALITIDQSQETIAQVHAAHPIDWFVYTAALRDNHPELTFARQNGIRNSKRDELLVELLARYDLQLIAVAGTHGKTTTTGMLVWLLQQTEPISYSIGTTISFGPSGQYAPGSRYFIYECDEYDRNFLHFHPELSLITSLDYDHPDTYPTQQEYSDAFRAFADQSERIITWPSIQRTLSATTSQFIEVDASLTDRIALPGEHNRRNGALAITAAQHLTGLQIDDLLTRLAHFPGTHRRFEKLGDNLYSDYGHHPVEIAATLQLAREVNPRVVLVYQPHQNIRQHQVRAAYPQSVQGAEAIYWLPTYASREDPNLPTLSPSDLTKEMSGPQLHLADMNDELWQAIQEARDSGALVLAMGAGSIDEWMRTRLAQSLSAGA